MRFLKEYFRRAIRACTEPASYADIRAKSRPPSWSYFFTLLATFALLSSFMVTAHVAMFDLHALFARIGSEAVAAYPDELVITTSGGVLSVNQETPYEVPMPQHWQTFFEAADSEEEVPFSNLAVFIGDAEVPLDDIRDLDAFLVFTDTMMYGLNPAKGEIRAFDVSVLGDRVIAKENIAEWNAMGISVLSDLWLFQKWFYVPMAFLLVFGAFFMASAGFRIVQLLLFSLLGFAVAAMFFGKAKLRFSEVFHLGMYALTPVIVLQWLAGLIGFPYAVFPVSLLVFLVWLIAGMRHIAARPQSKRKLSDSVS